MVSEAVCKTTEEKYRGPLAEKNIPVLSLAFLICFLRHILVFPLTSPTCHGYKLFADSMNESFIPKGARLLYFSIVVGVAMNLQVYLGITALKMHQSKSRCKTSCYHSAAATLSAFHNWSQLQLQDPSVYPSS